MECKIPYIFNSNISDSEKQRLNLIHLEVFSRAKNSGAFRQFNNKLYSIKNKYSDSLKFVNSINEENKQIIAKLNQSQPGQFYLSVNTLPLANQQGELFYSLNPKKSLSPEEYFEKRYNPVTKYSGPRDKEKWKKELESLKKSLEQAYVSKKSDYSVFDETQYQVMGIVGDLIPITLKFLDNIKKNNAHSTTLDKPFSFKDANPKENEILGEFYNDVIRELKSTFGDKPLPKAIPNERLIQKLSEWLNENYGLQTLDAPKSTSPYGLYNILNDKAREVSGGEVFIADKLNFPNIASGHNKLLGESGIRSNTLGWFIENEINGDLFLYEFQSDIIPEIQEGDFKFDVKRAEKEEGSEENQYKINVNGLYNSIYIKPSELGDLRSVINEILSGYIDDHATSKLAAERAMRESPAPVTRYSAIVDFLSVKNVSSIMTGILARERSNPNIMYQFERILGQKFEAILSDLPHERPTKYLTEDEPSQIKEGELEYRGFVFKKSNFFSYIENLVKNISARKENKKPNHFEKKSTIIDFFKRIDKIDKFSSKQSNSYKLKAEYEKTHPEFRKIYYESRKKAISDFFEKDITNFLSPYIDELEANIKNEILEQEGVKIESSESKSIDIQKIQKDYEYWYKIMFEKFIKIALKRAKDNGYNDVYLPTYAAMKDIESSKQTGRIYTAPQENQDVKTKNKIDETKSFKLNDDNYSFSSTKDEGEPEMPETFLKNGEKITEEEYNKAAEQLIKQRKIGPFYAALSKVKGVNIVGLETPEWSKEPLLKVNLENYKAERIERFQLEGGLPSSPASEATIEKVKEIAKKMGVNIQDLAKYAKETGLEEDSINAIADLTRGIIAVAQGKENTVLTEEMVHIATAIIEQKNPQLITALISKIDRFKIFKATLDLYKGNKNYQLPDGKPDIRKIKKEAVDKLIAEVIINQNEGTTEYPELLQEENRFLVRQWWDAILDFIRGIYTKANIDLFEEVGKKILSEDIGTVNDLKSRGLYFNLQDDLYNTIIDRDSRLKVIPATETKKRHYLFDNKEVASTVTEKIKKGNKFEERSSLDKENDEIRREFGDRGHVYIRNYVEQNWLDEKGYKLDKKKDVDIESGLPDSITEKVEKFTDNLINSYPEGTRFLLEKKVINERVKGGIASAIDFIAIKPDGKVDILDWKFTSVNKEQNKDIPFYKQNEWKEQMKEYVYILRNYGLKEEDVDKARMMPLIIDWKYRVAGNKESGLVPKSIEIADVNNPKETELYLLPVPSDLELTKNKEVDKLLASLDQYYEKLYKKPVEEKDRPSKLENLAKLAEAIRRLHVQLDFNPLLDVITQFMKDASKTMSTFSNLDFEKASKEEIQNNLTELLQFKNSALKFADLDEVYLGGRNRSELSEEERKLIDEFATHGAAVRRMLDRILELEKEYIVYLASKEGISKEAVLSPELEIKFMGKTFIEWSDLPSSIINLGQKLLDTSKNEVDLQFSKVYSRFSDLLLALEKTTKNPFDAIGTVVNGELKLKYKLDKSFLDKIKEAKSNRDKKYLLSIIDKDEFKRLADAYIKEQETIFNERHYSSDEKENESKRKYAIKQLKDSIDIDKESFTGYNSYQFNVLLNKTLKEEGHYSKEYQEMAKNQAALDMWNFFTEWNDKAKQMGYLTNKGLSFFPLIEATITQKLANTDNLIKELGNVYKDLYQIRLEEEQGYGKMDPETGKLRKEIPKFYTKTNKEVHQLSKDLNKIGALWIKALLDYQANSDIKDTLLAMYDVEKSKGNIVVSGGEATTVEGENANAPILQNMIDDGIFMIKENLNSVGNLVVSNAVSSLVKDKEKREEKVTSFKKGLRNADKLTQSLAVGWKLLVTIPNYFGTNFQSFINSGNYYTFSEYLKNQATILNPLKLSDSNKALINAFIPLTESITLEERRKLAKKQGIGNYLSTWSFHDVMMATNSYPDKLLQLTNALSILKNTIVIDGKIYNARQYLKVKDRDKYKLSQSERKEVESSFNERLNKLIEEHSIEKLITKDGDVQGVSNEEVAKYRAKILDHARKLSGQVSENNKADYRRDTILKSFMMFKNWIPKQISLRTLGVRKSLQSNDWEYGRTRAFVSTAIFLGIRNIGQMRDIIKGTDKGLKILDEMLKQKKEEYFLKNGKHLEITNEEFYDLMRSALKNQMKENIMLISLILMLVAVRVQKPPEDESDKFVINRWKSWMKVAYKISDELFFYYNPLSFEEMTRGSIVPSLGLLTKSEKFFKSFAKEMYGEAYNDQDIIDKNYPLKYFLDLIPGPSQFDKEILPLLDPELAKSMGIRLTETARQSH